MSKRKEYNPAKSEAIQGKAEMDSIVREAKDYVTDLCLVLTHGNKPILLNVHSQDVVEFDRSYANVFKNIPLDWSAHLCVFTIDGNGNEKVSVVDEDPGKPLLLNELNKFIGGKLIIQGRQAIKTDLANIGWVAVPKKSRLHSYEVKKLFKHSDAFKQYGKGNLSL